MEEPYDRDILKTRIQETNKRDCKRNHSKRPVKETLKMLFIKILVRLTVEKCKEDI